MNTSPSIVCARVKLRRLEERDAGAIAGYRSDPLVAKYQSWETYSLSQAEALCKEQVAAEFGRRGTWAQLAIVLASDGTVIGDCGLYFLAEDTQQLELGVTLGTSVQGQGLACEAISGVLDLAFFTLKMHRVVARTDAENVKAAALFGRLGFRREAHFVNAAMFKGAWCSEFSFGILRDEWVRNPLAGRASVGL